MRPAGEQSKRIRRSIYELLNITAEEVAAQPIVRHEVIKKMCSVRQRNPGAPSSYIYCLRASESPEAQAYLKAYDSIPRHNRPYANLEIICTAIKISPWRMFEVIAGAAERIALQSSRLVSALNQPAMVEKTIERAMDDNREDAVDYVGMFHKATGYLPTPKSAQTTINVQQNATAQASAAPQIAVVAAPPPEQTIRKLADRFNERRALPPTTAVPMPDAEPTRESVAVDAEYEDEDDR
jgi:hypothetical protein